MKIINVVQDFQVGGIQKLLLEYLRYFKDNKDIDYNVVVLESGKNSNYDKICKEEGLKIHYLNGHSSTSNHYFIRQFVLWKSYDYALYKYLKKEKPDIVHTHNTRIFKRIQWCIKKLHKKYKWFHSLHSDPYAVSDVHIPIAQRTFNKYGVKPICLNETQFTKAKERYGLEKCYYLNNSFDQQNLKQNIIPADEFKKLLGIPKDAFIVGAIGRIHPVKNYPFFLDVIAEIKKTKTNVLGIIVGNSIDSQELIDKINLLNISKNILLTGSRCDVQNFYNIFDRYMLTSTSEGSSFTLLEAQLFNKYCIVSDCIPDESICLNNKVVKLNLTTDIKKWAQQVISPSLFADPAASLDDYSIEKVSQNIIQIYSK